MSTRTPPAVAPKPGGKMYVYVYETPEQGVPANGPKIRYPRSDECVKHDNTKWKPRGRRYVSETSLRNTSRGGRMFEKQKNRMKEYVFTAPAKSTQQTIHNNPYPSTEGQKVSYTKVYSMPVPVGSKNMPALVSNTMSSKNKKKMSGPVIRPLQSPPPQWRAKVDADYSSADAMYQPEKFEEQEYLVEAGYESAPPEDTNPEEFYYDRDQDVRSLHEFRTDLRGNSVLPVAYYYNAKTSSKPSYFQRKRISQATYVGAPYIENDFNARAVGWSRAYAENY